MKTILNPGFEKILTVFYHNRNQKFHLREISRRTKLNENSTSRFLAQLLERQILLAERDGNLKKFSIRNGLPAYAALAYLDSLRFASLPSIRQRAVRLYLESLKEQPVFAVLFGSTAKNTYREDSDIDLLLIVNKKVETSIAAKKSEAQTGLRVNVLQATYTEFLSELRLKEDHVLQSALASGFPVTNHIALYECVNQ